jgi:hypothetical protein
MALARFNFQTRMEPSLSGIIGADTLVFSKEERVLTGKDYEKLSRRANMVLALNKTTQEVVNP